MKLSIRGLALAGGLIWGGSVLFVGLIGQASPGYGHEFLVLAGSIYPGFKVDGSLGDLIVGALYALLDGAVGGAIFAWLYNLFAGGARA